MTNSPKKAAAISIHKAARGKIFVKIAVSFIFLAGDIL